MTNPEVDVPTPAPTRPAPEARGARPRRRPRLVQDHTGVRLKEHAAQDRSLLELVERLLAA